MHFTLFSLMTQSNNLTISEVGYSEHTLKENKHTRKGSFANINQCCTFSLSQIFRCKMYM